MSDFLSGVLTGLVVVVIFAFSVFFPAWILMLLLGVIASLSSTAGLALGFWVCVPIAFLLRLLFGH